MVSYIYSGRQTKPTNNRPLYRPREKYSYIYMRALPIEIIDTECVLSSFFAVKILFLQNGVFQRAFLLVPGKNCAWCECIFCPAKFMKILTITNCVIYLSHDLQPSPGYQTSLPAVFFQLVKLDVCGNVKRFQG